MSQTTQCRLCLQHGADQKLLYDESGKLNLEIFNKMKTFFNPKFLNIHMAICLGCWHHISKFHQLLTSFVQNQYNIDDNNADTSWQDALRPLQLADKTFSASLNEVFEQHQQNKQAQQVKWLITEYDSEDSQTDTASLIHDIKEEISTEEFVISENFIPTATEKISTAECVVNENLIATTTATSFRRRGKNTSLDKRKLAIFHFKNGETQKKIADILNLKPSTVGDIIKRYQKENRIVFKKQTGQPKKLTDMEERFLVKKIMQNPRLSASKIVIEIKKEFGKTLCEATIRRKIKQVEKSLSSAGPKL